MLSTVLETTSAAAPPTAMTPTAKRITTTITATVIIIEGRIVPTLNLQAREPNLPASSCSPASLWILACKKNSIELIRYS